MLRSILGTRARPDGAAQQYSPAEETKALENAMTGVLHVMDDDVVTADKVLSEQKSAFHLLGKGLTMFLQAVLGFEQDVMREAAQILSDAETVAGEQQRKAQKHPESPATTIYPPGTEYALIIAEAQCLRAILGVLSESLTESIKGFYNLRRAYQTLDGILNDEKRYLEKKGITSVDTARLRGSALDDASTKAGSTPNIAETTKAIEKLDADDDEDEEDEFADAEEALEGQAVTGQSTPKKDEQTVPETTEGRQKSIASFKSIASGPDMDVFEVSTMDGFVHAGSNLCFGILLLLISIIPPAFGMLLKMIGFRGDRERGLAMLWQATKSRKDVHGTFAGLVLLGYYNGALSFCDILPENAIPRTKCKDMLNDMRGEFPLSRMWVLEEARMLAQDKKMDEGAALLDSTEKSPLRQVYALQIFERSLDHMCMHEYEGCAQGFVKCVDLNNWSHGLYYYIAGSAMAAEYRKAKTEGDTAAAEKHAAEATRLMKLVPQHSGKKRFLSRQLPFDVFACRKIQKWEERAKAWKVELIDAIGANPMEEMIYFWNGYKRMRPAELEQSLKNLDWSEKHNPLWEKEGLDERALIAVLRATALRNLGRREEAKEILQSQVLAHDWSEFKGGHKDSWSCPVAHFEMAVNLWEDRDGSAADRQKEQECSKYVEKVANWEEYDLQARIGLRVATARATLRQKGSTS